MSAWRASLGEVEVTQQAITRPLRKLVPAKMEQARRLAGAVDRAAKRLPYSPKCLPQAMALQWALSAEGIGARLVIATQKDGLPQDTGPIDDDLHHAWVEVDGQMLIGACDRAAYRPVLGFSVGIQPTVPSDRSAP